jgi:hypothetical protein
VAGVTIPVGQGLLTDARRNALAEARGLRDAAVADRQAQVNELLFAAARDYAAWYEARRRRTVAREGVELALGSYRFVRSRFENGDAAAIDTIEAGLELQRRLVAQLEADNAWFVTSQVVSTYLWDERAVPYDLAPGVVPTLAGLAPMAADTTAIDGWLARALERHPDLLKVLARQRVAEANRRYYGQELLPDVTFDVAAIKDGATGPFSDWPGADDNYKFGLAGKTSLLLMKERGRYNAAGARVESAALEAAVVRRELRTTVLASANEGDHVPAHRRDPSAAQSRRRASCVTGRPAASRKARARSSWSTSATACCSRRRGSSRVSRQGTSPRAPRWRWRWVARCRRTGRCCRSRRRHVEHVGRKTRPGPAIAGPGRMAVRPRPIR